MNFVKFEALGNDFCIFGSPDCKIIPDKDLLNKLCDRHYGVGCDCAVFIGYSEHADYFMHVYNPDGFEAEICGNALRCSAKYVSQKGFFKKRVFSVETRSGSRMLSINDEIITAEIGKASIIDKNILELPGITIPYVHVSIGNPHCVVFVSGISDDEFKFFGKLIEKHPRFPDGTNVEFAQLDENGNIHMRVWERGIGETLSCSTGSCACVAAANEMHGFRKKTNVYQPGGIVTVEHRECGNMFINGECTAIFEGNLL